MRWALLLAVLGSLAAASPAAASQDTYLVAPNVGLMLWMLVTFGITLLVLRRWAFPRIGKALDDRRELIEGSIDAAQRSRREADELLQEYRHRLREAREQAEEIVQRAHRAADQIEADAKEEAKEARQQSLERTKREIEAETRRSLDALRQEVADLTVLATERITRKSLDADDHRRLIEEALEEADFSMLSADRNGANGSRDGAEQRQEEQASA